MNRPPFPGVPVHVPGGPSVHNKKAGTAPKGAVYCGRPSKRGNPFVIGRDGTREDVVLKFEAHYVSTGDAAQAERELRGQDLVCWCAPELCHAHVILWYANPDARPI